jgi:hypothetical protein
MLFGRDSNAPEYDSVLDEWINGSDASFRSIGINLRHDARVSPARAELLDVLFGHPRDGNSLMNGIKRYKEKRVQGQYKPDFVRADLNEDNFVRGLSGGSGDMDGDVWLVRVLDLNGLWEFLEWAKYQYPEFASFPQSRPDFDADVSGWWRSTFESLPPDDIDKLIGVMLDALAKYGSALQYQPVWVTTWAAMQPHLDRGPDRWAHAVGVQPRSAERWLLMLKYRARRAGRMAAPQQLDSGWYQYFFPTPPIFPHGHPMDLAPVGAGPLAPEYIHCQISYNKADYLAAGRRYAATTGEPVLAAPECRSRHHEMLAGIREAVVAAWMPKAW